MKAKRSAEGNAALRYAAAHDDDPRLTNPDRLAGDFIRRRYRVLAETSWLRKVALPLYERKFPGAYAYQTARTRLFDAVLLDAVQNNAVRQVVILGAGCDSRALRFHDKLASAAVFELDFPATQARKVQLLRRASRAGWESVKYVPVDFETDDWQHALVAEGLDADLPVVVLWEGVAMFLERAAVDATLDFVAQSAAGSSVVFDYVVRDALTVPQKYLGGEAVSTYMRRGGELWKFGVAHDEVAEVVSARGLELWDLWSPEALSADFIGVSGTEEPREVLGFHGVARAGVGPRTTLRDGRPPTP